MTTSVAFVNHIPTAPYPFHCTLFCPFTFDSMSDAFLFISFFLQSTDSVIGIRSNYGMNADANLPPSAATVVTAANDSMHAYANQPNQLLYDPSHHRDKSPNKTLESVNVHVVDNPVASASTVPSATPTSAQLVVAHAPPPTITVTPTDEPDKTIDGMLDRISHDLDYLLNRMAEIPPAPPPPTATIPSASQSSSSSSLSSSMHPTNLSVHEVILEEEAEDL